MERHRKFPSVCDYHVNHEIFTLLSYLQTAMFPNLDLIWYGNKMKQPNGPVNQPPTVLFTRNRSEGPEMGEQMSVVQLCASLGCPLRLSVKQGVQPGDPTPWQPLSTPEVLWLPIVASQRRLNFQREILVKSLPACYSPTAPCPPAGSPEQPCLALRLQNHSRSPRSRMTALS